eukprot:m.55187 g.55187  ORF g.55187 m.55187 type:complete len:68 (+) comp22031_c0_seq1:381-584(+)
MILISSILLISSGADGETDTHDGKTDTHEDNKILIELHCQSTVKMVNPTDDVLVTVSTNPHPHLRPL